ncbi:MAG: GTP pyrophosphokinase [Candidatus Hydrogenedentota bacterium]
MREEFAKLLKQLRKNTPGADLELVRKAYRVANDAHRGVERDSGDPYISHPLEVARILAQLNLDPTTVAAGLLHDVLEDTGVERSTLVKEFGEEIASLVDGVSKIKTMKWSSQQSQQEKQAENLRKMLVATAKDVRVILIKLADRLHNMRTIEFLRDKQRVERICRETLDIYAPLAHRLGIARWKWELEDHAFHHLNPVEYKRIATHVAMKRREREAWLNETIAYLEARLAEAEVSARVIGRPKHLYSIYRKMVQQGKSFDEVYDILAVRIVTQTVAGCYNALGVVHQLWTPVPGRFKDYIAMPKTNLYQSIHTIVMRENGFPLEIQIRTEDMDRIAREGIAAHWAYKEGTTDQKLDNELRWFRQTYEWLQDAHAPDEVLDSVRRDMGRSDVYVFTPKGEVKELPEGATPLDFAYNVHSDIGHHCIGARVNGKLVPLRYNLQTGDVVEILTSRSQTPHLDWLELVVTGKARTRIRQKLRELGELEPLEGQLRKDAVRVLPESKPKIKQVDDATRNKLIRVDGTKGIAVQFAKCCAPMPGHAVIGYATKSPGITIHRADCRNFASTNRDPARIIAASWDGEDHIELGMRVTVGQRPNMLADITNALRPMNISITRAQFHPGENGKSLFEFVFEAPDRDSVARVAATIRHVSGVTDVQHMPVAALGHAHSKT